MHLSANIFGQRETWSRGVYGRGDEWGGNGLKGEKEEALQ